MNSITRRNLVAGVALLAAFALLTVLVQLVDVRPVGQNGTNVGFHVQHLVPRIDGRPHANLRDH